jgi:hypothetical protein
MPVAQADGWLPFNLTFRLWQIAYVIDDGTAFGALESPVADGLECIASMALLRRILRCVTSNNGYGNRPHHADTGH